MEITPSILINFLNRFSGKRILVLGGLMVDHYIFGEATRISPEAPVPIVNVHHTERRLGGAANTIHNIISQGGIVDAVGIVGDDDEGKWLIDNLKMKGVDVTGIIRDKKRPTTSKTRVMVGQHQIVRFDNESTDEIDDDIEQMILDLIEEKINYIDCITISDYDKGLITKNLINSLVEIADERGKIIVVDPKVRHHLDYKGVTILKTNVRNAMVATGLSASCIKEISEIGKFLLMKLQTKGVIVTLGRDGMIVIDDDSHVVHIPALAKQVYDVTGAGDVVTSTLSLAISAGATLKEAAVLGSVAAAIKVGKIGTATVTREEIKALLNSIHDSVIIKDVQ